MGVDPFAVWGDLAVFLVDRTALPIRSSIGATWVGSCAFEGYAKAVSELFSGCSFDLASGMCATLIL